ncbi:hypothetical protein Efla_004839 [Eimeria flavescens]
MSGQSHAAAAQKIAGLLTTATKASALKSAGQQPSRPLVVAYCRPFERSSLRTLLGCQSPTGSEPEEGVSHDNGNLLRKSGSAEASTGWWDSGLSDVWSKISLGLEVLPSGAFLLTVESPCGEDLYAVRSKTTEAETKTLEGKTDAQGAARADGGVASRDSKASSGEKMGASAGPSLVMPCATEATVLASLAGTVMASADVLLLPLLYQNVVSAPYRPFIQPLRQLGELFFMDTSSKAAADAGGDVGATAAKASSRTSSARPEEPSTVNKVATEERISLPQDVVQLLRAMRRARRLRLVQQAAADNTKRATGQPNMHMERGAGQAQAKSQSRIPHIVLLFGRPLSPEVQAALKSEVLRHFGEAEGKSGASSSHAKAQIDQTSRQFDHCVITSALRKCLRWCLVSSDSLATFVTGNAALGPPSAVEFPSRAVASGVCAAAARHAWTAARKHLSELQKSQADRLLQRPFGSEAQRILSEALSSYDWQTRRFLISQERKVLRNELRLGLEREIRSLHLREVLRIEADAKAHLRAALIEALQRDAPRFGLLARSILMETLSTVSKQLMDLLPCTSASLSGRSMYIAARRFIERTEASDYLLEEQSLAASAAAARDAWQCHIFSKALLELHDLLLEKITRNFTILAIEISRSPLAALLRQQHNRSWLGLSLRPSLSLTALLRTRGEGNLQGYSRYNKGPLSFLFGFTNDGDGLKPNQHAAFRVQPKLHLDVDVA